MVKVSLHIDAKSFGRKFNKMLDSPRFKLSAYQIMELIYEAARERLIHSFNESKITQEIEAGPEAETISGLMEDGYGNLYTFIGFDADQQNPIEKLREYLEDSITLEQTVRRNDRWFFRITVPSRKEIASETPMEWEQGNSWIEGIEEEGISNLSNYMYKAWDTSRSTHGIQIPYEYREGATMSTSPYLLHMLEEFKTEIKEAQL